MNWNGSRHSILIARGGQPSASTIAGNHDLFLHPGTCQVVRLPRRRGEAETPTSNRLPRGAQGRRLLGPAALRTCPFASLLSQVQARLRPGGYCWCSGNGVTQTCLPTAHGVAVLQACTARLHQRGIQDPRKGPSLVRWTTQDLLRSGLTRLPREER